MNTTSIILRPIEDYIKTLPAHLKLKVKPLTKFQKISIFESNLDRFIKVKMTKRGIAQNTFYSDEMFNDVLAHLLGYSGYMKNPKPFSTFWINSFKEGLQKEAKELPVVIKFLSTTINKAISRFIRDNQLLTETTSYNKDGTARCSFSSIDKVINDDSSIHEVLADPYSPPTNRMDKFLKSALQLLNKDSVPHEMLKLFLSGVSKREMVYHLQKFGVNGKGGTHSKDKQMSCRINHFYFNTKLQKKQPLTPRLALAHTTPIDVIFEARHASFSSQLVAHYLKSIKEYIQELWNSFEAQTTEEMINTDNQAGTQFFNWEVPECNKYSKDKSMLDNSYFIKESA